MRIFNLVAFLIATCALAAGFGTCDASGQAHEQDHEDLRALRRTLVEAVSSKKLDLLKPVVDTDFVVITVDNQKLVGLDQFRDYWTRLFEGDAPILNGIAAEAEADAPTEFLGEDVGVTQGTSQSTFDFRTVGKRELPVRWTAIVRKVDGRWKLSKLHLSGNINDNPMVDATKTLGNLKAGGGFAVGLVAGVLFGWFLFRRKKPHASAETDAPQS